MNYDLRLELSFYQEIATINEAHKIYLVQHINTNKFFVKKILSVYNISIYQQIMKNPIKGIPKIYGLYEENNELTLIEEYIPGNSLSELLLDESPMSEELVKKYTIELCEILESLHSFNPAIIHRDIKPSNVIITPDNQVVLIDLNAAKSSTTKEEDTILLGTIGYAAPEQYGFGSSNVQTDIYAVGMLLNTMLTGKFSKSLIQSDNYHSIIERCTKLDPRERFDSISSLKHAIKQIHTTKSTSKKAKTDWKKFLPPGFRSLKIWHMLIAMPIYTFIIILCLSLEVKDTFGIALWFERAMCLLMFLSIIACSTNYLNIQKIMPLCTSKKLLIRLIGIIILSISIVLILFIILFLIESIVFK